MNAIKTTVYVCSSLMLGAAVFGAIDYNSATKKGTLKQLYKEDEPIVTNNLIIQAKKEVGFDDYSRGPIEDRTARTQTKKKEAAIRTKKVQTDEPANETLLTDAVTIKEKRNGDVFNGKKRISIESFSRAPLYKTKREVEEIIKTDTTIAVVEEKKTAE
jgi:hypothetical protein